METFLQRIAQFGDLEQNVSLKSLTTFKVGGIASYVIYPNDNFALQAIIDICKDSNMPYKVFGHGSNMLCSDKQYDGVIIKLNRKLNQVYFDGTEIVVQAGYSIVSLSYECMKRSLSGLEFASGIPGTIGGCIFMNAGAYKKSMGDITKEVQVLKDGSVVWLSNEECEFEYRSSIFQKHPDWIILAAKIQLEPGEKDEIQAIMRERQQRRFDTQPLDYPSAGSVFRNLDGYFAWQLIDKIGYRGTCYGDACVSPKHSNFIINNGNAKAEDIVKLIDDIQAKIKREFDLDMILEVEKFNW